MFIVPLYAILQTHSPPGERSRIIAANNIVNAGVDRAGGRGRHRAAGARASACPGVIGALGFATLAVALISLLAAARDGVQVR